MGRDSSAGRRRQILAAVAEVFRAERFDTIQLMADEAVKVVREGDPEVSEAIDFATYYGTVGLDVVDLQRAEGAASASTGRRGGRFSVELPVRHPRRRGARRLGSGQRR